MITRISLVLGVAFGLGLLAVPDANAAQSQTSVQASTAQLPAALKALNPQSSKILLHSEALQVRGKGFKNPAGNFYGYKPGNKHPGSFKNPAGNFKGYKPGN